MPANVRSFTTPLELPQIPTGVPPELFEEFLRLYNAITALALQMDKFVSLSQGLYLKDTQATPHYWLVTVSNLGVLQTTDTGTSPPV